MDYVSNDINEATLDILRELQNIGAGNAATALSNIISNTVDMSVPHVRILEFNKVASLLGGPENMVAGILIEMSSDLSGYLMFLLEWKDAKLLVSTIMGMPSDESDEMFDEMGISVLQEVTNIITGAYISAISSLTGLTIAQSVPDLAVDMAGAILNVPVTQYGQMGETVLLVETKFVIDGKSLTGNFFLMPDYESFKVLMKTLTGE